MSLINYYDREFDPDRINDYAAGRRVNWLQGYLKIRQWFNEYLPQWSRYLVELSSADRDEFVRMQEQQPFQKYVYFFNKLRPFVEVMSKVYERQNLEFEKVEDMEVDSQYPKGSIEEVVENRPPKRMSMEMDDIEFKDEPGAKRGRDDTSWTPEGLTPYPSSAKRTSGQTSSFKSWLQQQPKWYRDKRAQLYYARKEHPAKDYGIRYVKRGTPENLSRYGERWTLATPQQKEHRKLDGYIGKGYYSNTGYGATGSGRYRLRDFTRDARHLFGNRLINTANTLINNKLLGMGSYGYPGIGYHGRGAYMGNSGTDPGLGYDMGTNQLINKITNSRHIDQVVDETNNIVISHREYIGDVTPTSTGFQTQYFLAINPGLAGTFPWLSNIAQFYEEYELVQCLFEFISMVTEGNGTAAGNIIMASQYNPTSPAFQTKQTMENYDYANSGKVTTKVVHGVECDPAKRGGNIIEYVRTGAVPTNQDLKTYDLATFQLATNGAAANLNIGELWVTYKVKLGKTKLTVPGVVSRVNSAYARANVPAGNMNANGLFGAATITESNFGNGLSIAGNGITLPVGISSGRYVLSAVIIMSAVASALTPGLLTFFPGSVGTSLVSLVASTQVSPVGIDTVLVLNAEFTVNGSASVNNSFLIGLNTFANAGNTYSSGSLSLFQVFSAV
jgi:hypothetical protein